MQDREAHGKPIDRLVADLETHRVQGLDSRQARQRLASQGANELAERPRPGFWALLGAQFDNYLVIILLVAAGLSLLLGEVVDAVAIAVIVLLNAVVGVIQEAKAEQALAALKRMAAPAAQVVRDGHLQSVPGSQLVPGDLVLLEAGNFVPADLRLVETHNLRVEEASLTGESVPVAKDAAVLLDREIPLGDRSNSAFMGTLVTAGRGRGIVVCTGMNTQIGLIAQMLQSVEADPTPLQRKLAQLGRVLGSACLAVCAVVFFWGLVRDTRIAEIGSLGLIGYLEAERQPIVALFMTAVSLAIAAVPEGLPAIVTVCLALGMQRMIRHHALIRRLPAVETLGCATVICSDKTGTLTQNRMTVVQAWAGGRLLRLAAGAAGGGAVYTDGHRPVDPAAEPDLQALLQGAAACNDARLEAGADGAGFSVVGDPTEAALVVAARLGGVSQAELERRLPRVAEVPFDADRKRMSTLHRREPGGPAGGFEFPPQVAIVKGAPDRVLGLCATRLSGGRTEPLDEAGRAEIVAVNRQMAAQALRVLAVAYRPLDELPASPDADAVERDLVFVGLLGMIDPPRPEAMAAIEVARGAGLRTVMVTGDHRDTAEAIARDIGLRTPGGLVLTGADIDRLSDADLAAAADRLEVCCRVSPQHKTRIVDAFRARGHVVAMTGDGVNDAPALKRAHIGVAMGVTGTDVAKQTADMVLTDDNFASIVAAVEQGRVIYSNIRKFVYFLLACNVGEILIVFGAMLFGLPMPLRPVQLLWLNLVSDGAPALALGLEKGDPDIMRQPARARDEPVIDRSMALGIAVVGLVDMLAVLVVFQLALQRHPGQVEAAQTIAFVTLCVSELLRVFSARSELQPAWRVSLGANPWLPAAVLVSLGLVLAVVYLPFLAPFFDAVPPTAGDWLLMLPFFFASPLAMEVLKALHRHRPGPAAEPGPGRPAPPGLPPPPDPGGRTMKRILLPVAGTANDRFAVQEVVRRFMNDTSLEVHVLNVQAPFSSDVAGFTSRRSRDGLHRERAERALAPVREAFDRLGLPYAVHAEVGERAARIADAARRLGCDEIVMATARKNSLTRWIENSVTERVIERSPVPVEVVPGDSMSRWERWGVPAAVGAALALAFAAAD